jgi:hypothetical protein
MTNRPVEPAHEHGADSIGTDQVASNPETDSAGRPEPVADQPAEVETGDAVREPVDPPEDPGVDPPVEDSGEPVPDPPTEGGQT